MFEKLFESEYLKSCSDCFNALLKQPIEIDSISRESNNCYWFKE